MPSIIIPSTIYSIQKKNNAGVNPRMFRMEDSYRPMAGPLLDQRMI